MLPIPVTEAEIEFLYPPDPQAGIPNGIDPSLWQEMRSTYASIGSHNRWLRENCPIMP